MAPESGAQSRSVPGPAAGLSADQIVGSLLPPDLDWVRLVKRYPWTSLALAAGAGFVLGRRRGPVIVEALTTTASERVSESVERFLNSI